MSLITIPNTFSAGAVIIASQHNANFSTIVTDFNGNIDNNNISASAAIAYSKLNLAGSILNADVGASAAIVDTKLAQITTASKVHGTSITGLASLPAGAGVVPVANLGTGASATTFLRGDNTFTTAKNTYTAGTYVLASANTERTTTSSTYAKIKEFYISSAGTIRVSMELKAANPGTNNAYGRVYRNGSAVGVENVRGDAAYATFTDDVSGWATGDLLQVYTKNLNNADLAYIKNVFIEVTNPNFEVTILD